MSTPSLRRGFGPALRDFTVRVTLPDGTVVTLENVPGRSTVDHFKAYCFRNIPELKGKPLSKYRLEAKGMALVDFQPLPNAHPVLARQYRTGQPLELCMAEAPVGSPAGTPDKSPVRQSWHDAAPITTAVAKMFSRTRSFSVVAAMPTSPSSQAGTPTDGAPSSASPSSDGQAAAAGSASSAPAAAPAASPEPAPTIVSSSADAAAPAAASAEEAPPLSPPAGTSSSDTAAVDAATLAEAPRPRARTAIEPGDKAAWKAARRAHVADEGAAPHRARPLSSQSDAAAEGAASASLPATGAAATPASASPTRLKNLKRRSAGARHSVALLPLSAESAAASPVTPSPHSPSGSSGLPSADPEPSQSPMAPGALDAPASPTKSKAKKAKKKKKMRSARRDSTAPKVTIEPAAAAAPTSPSGASDSPLSTATTDASPVSDADTVARIAANLNVVVTTPLEAPTTSSPEIEAPDASPRQSLGAAPVRDDVHGVGTLLLAPHDPIKSHRRHRPSLASVELTVPSLSPAPETQPLETQPLAGGDDSPGIRPRAMTEIRPDVRNVPKESVPAGPNQKPLLRKPTGNPLRRPTLHLAAQPKQQKDKQANAAGEWDFITYGVHDVRPVGSRPLAYSRIKVPVVYSDTELSFRTPSVRPANGWIVEMPRISAAGAPPPIELELTEYMGNRFFAQHFQNYPDSSFYVATSEATGPLIICTRQETVEDAELSPELVDTEGGVQRIYKVLLRSREGDDMVAMATAAVPVPLWRSKPSSRAIIRTVDDRFASASLALREIKAPKDRERFATELAKLEKRQLTTTFKFGVLYAKPHQTTEEEMFSNTTGSPGFERFLDMLGQRARLKGWTRFRAGLDVQTDTTGTHSVYTTMDDYEIMFHVSTLLPHNPRDPQQVERKRHIGNDICVIVYLDAPGPGEAPRTQPIDASLIHSDYTHILAIVEPTVGDPMAPDDERDRYTLTMCCKDTVPRYGPPLATGGHYKRDEYFRQVLLTKLINGENACGSAQVFESKLVRTRTALYKAFVESFAS